MRPVPRSVAVPHAAGPRRSRAHGAEDVLCVPRSTIFPDGAWHGLIARGLERVLRTVHATSEYRPRAEVEDDPTLQQIIPYCVVHHPHDDTYLLTRRLRRSSEKRLHHLYSLGIGGQHGILTRHLQHSARAGGFAASHGCQVTCLTRARPR